MKPDENEMAEEVREERLYCEQKRRASTAEQWCESEAKKNQHQQLNDRVRVLRISNIFIA